MYNGLSVYDEQYSTQLDLKNTINSITGDMMRIQVFKNKQQAKANAKHQKMVEEHQQQMASWLEGVDREQLKKNIVDTTNGQPAAAEVTEVDMTPQDMETYQQYLNNTVEK